MRTILSLAAAVLLTGPTLAAPPTPPSTGESPSGRELAEIMRPILLAMLPDPIYQKGFDWGKQKEVMNGITWEKKGILLKPHKQEKFKNDGMWRRVNIEAVNPEKNLNVVIANVRKPEKGKLTYDMLVTMPTRITVHQQLWKRGIRLYSGETRAHCRPLLLLSCESTTKVEKNGSVLPDVVFRMRVVDAKLSYDQFKVEHTAGVGGEMAEILGNAAHDLLKRIRPSLEKDMLDKAGKSIVKAGDTKEVKLGLGKLFHDK